MAELQLKVRTHPRIHLVAADVPILKTRAATTHRVFYEKLIRLSDAFEPDKLPKVMGLGDDDRNYGDQLSMLSFAYLLSENPKYLAYCRALLKPMLETETWQDGIGLVTGHQMAGVCNMYDWLYDALEPAERERIREKIRSQAALTYKASREQRAWWHDMFFQNWCHVPTATLVYAAAALAGEVPEADDWIAQGDFVFTLVKEALSDDGNCEEGQGYMGYAWNYILRVFDIERSVFGRDHFADSKWCRNAPYAMLYARTPKMTPRDNLMAFGDARRRLWDGPVFQLFKSALEYKDEVIQDFACRHAETNVGLGGPDVWLNLVWYDPAVGRSDYRKLPTSRFFPGLSTVYARSGWDEDAMLLGFKCTSNHTKHVKKAFPGRDLGVSHAHPDAASFQVYAFGEWLATDPGYSVFKVTQEHNTIMVNGVGQLGGEWQWFEGKETVSAEPCEITKFETTGDYDYIRADASGIYKPAAGLTRFIRHLVYLKPHDLLVVDELEAKAESDFEWYVHADGDIVAEGNRFFFSKNAANARVLWLAPADFTAETMRQKLAFVPTDPLEDVGCVRVKPAVKARTALFVAFLNFYKGGTPETEPSLVSTDNGVVTVELEGAGGKRVLALDMVNATVKLSG